MAAFVDGSTLGSGGFGEVCVCTKDGASYAKKKLIAAADPAAEERFLREVRILSSLDHPNIVKVVAHKLRAKPYWYVMPLYRGSLETELTRLPGQAARINKLFKAILDGVEFAHKEGVLHRDLKPGNVLLNNDDDVVISDFGLGRIVDSASTRQTQTGFGMGTMFYVAPEQVSDAKRADERCDIFSLGRILYVLHTGPVTSLHADLAKVPSSVRFVISKCTQPQPERRFQTVAELKQAWLIATGGVLQSSASDQIDALVGALVAGGSTDAGQMDELAEVILQNLDDSDFLHDAVMKVPAELFAAMAARRLDDVKSILRRFTDETVKEGYGFSYTDKIGRHCASLYREIHDFEVRADLLFCIMQVGFDHNRYYVMELFTTLLEASKEPGEGLAVVERLKDASQTRLKEIASRLSPAKLDKAVKGFLERYREK